MFQQAVKQTHNKIIRISLSTIFLKYLKEGLPDSSLPLSKYAADLTAWDLSTAYSPAPQVREVVFASELCSMSEFTMRCHDLMCRGKIDGAV